MLGHLGTIGYWSAVVFVSIGQGRIADSSEKLGSLLPDERHVLCHMFGPMRQVQGCIP